MSQESEEAEILDLVEFEQKSRTVEKLDHLPFGPCKIARGAWKRLRLIVKVNCAEPTPKEVPLALLGRLYGNQFVVEDVVQIVTNRSDSSQCVYDAEDVKKVEKEAAKEGLMLVGVGHTHTDRTQLRPSHADKIHWLSLVFDFDRPLYYYIISGSLEVGGYSIPPNLFLLLKEAFRFLPVDVKDHD